MSATVEIRPFHVDVPQEELDDLRRRIGATRFADEETVRDQSQGVQSATIRELARYWATEYDWRTCEARLNALPQFVTEIDGLNIHFIHVRSKHDDALPLIVTHGWPGSVIEQLKIIEPLTFRASRRTPAGTPTASRARGTPWDTLMKRLGYTQYVSQGGDWGARVSEALAHLAPEGLLGVHMNLLLSIPPEIGRALALGEPAPAELSEQEKAAYEQEQAFFTMGRGYFIEQATRPQTIGHSVADSPVGLAAWMTDHDARNHELIASVFAGRPAGLTRDDILDNITLYWLTDTGPPPHGCTGRTRASSTRGRSPFPRPLQSSRTRSSVRPGAGSRERSRTALR